MKIKRDVFFTYNYYRLMIVFHSILLIGNLFLCYSLNHTYLGPGDTIIKISLEEYVINNWDSVLKNLFFSIYLFFLSVLWLRIIHILTKGMRGIGKKRLMQIFLVIIILMFYTISYGLISQLPWISLTFHHIALIIFLLCFCFVVLLFFLKRYILFSKSTKAILVNKLSKVINYTHKYYVDYLLNIMWIYFFIYFLSHTSNDLFIYLFIYLFIFIFCIIGFIRWRILGDHINGSKNKMNFLMRSIWFFKYFVLFLILYFLLLFLVFQFIM